MSIRGACGMVFVAAAMMTLGALPGREHTVVSEAAPRIERLEAEVAAHPSDVAIRGELVQAYLDGRSPGLAWSVVTEAPESQQREPAIEHLAARVLIEQGDAKGALALERSVLATCGDEPVGSASNAGRAGCDFWLMVSATRRAGILEALVQQGVDDAIAHPEASLVAYHNATHEARLALAE
jgi:hypothetical protein